MVLDAIEQRQGSFTVEMIHKETLTHAATLISRSTVVNTVRLLVEAGIVSPSGTRGRHRTYVLAANAVDRRRGGFQVKIYMECTVCGKVKTTSDKSLTGLLWVKRYKSFNPASCSVNIYGVCTSCRRKQETKTKKK